MDKDDKKIINIFDYIYDEEKSKDLIDITGALQKAIEVINDKKGGTIFFPSGNYINKHKRSK